MQIEEGGKKKRTGVQIFTLSQRQEKINGKVSIQKMPVLKLLLGCHGRLCVLLWDALPACSRSASRAQDSCNVEPQFLHPMVRFGARHSILPARPWTIRGGKR